MGIIALEGCVYIEYVWRHVKLLEEELGDKTEVWLMLYKDNYSNFDFQQIRSDIRDENGDKIVRKRINQSFNIHDESYHLPSHLYTHVHKFPSPSGPYSSFFCTNN